MKVKEAKSLYKAGVISSLSAYRSFSKPDDWYIKVRFDDDVENIATRLFITNSLGEDKVYKRLNTLLGEIESITGEFYHELIMGDTIEAQREMFL